MRAKGLLSIAAFALVSGIASCSRGDTIVVGAKAFTEGYLFGHMVELLLKDAGFDVDEQFGLASAAMRGALVTGQVDVYVEYTGTAYAVYAHGDDRAVMADSARVLAAVRRVDSIENGLRWLRPLPFENTYVLVARRNRATELGLRTLDDLASYMRENHELVVAVNAEFYERADGMKALAAEYNMPLERVRKMEAGLIYESVNTGAIDIGMGFSTDGRIASFDLTVLTDNRHFFPAYHPAAVIRSELLQKHPRIGRVIERLNGVLDAPTMRRLNGLVDIEHHDPRKVARDFLASRGLIKAQ